MKITINQQDYEFQNGQTIIQIADQNNIVIPRFCYHKNLSVAANCRMCLVEIDGSPKPLAACSTCAQEGMRVHTASEKIKTTQQDVMKFLLINHPLDCPICDQGGECELQDVAMGFGLSTSKYQETKRVVADKDIGPTIQTEMTRCIHCTRCVRFGEEVAGVKELGAIGRGEHTTITTFLKQGVHSELSGNMIDLCPVGALTSKPFRYQGRSWEMTNHQIIAMHDVFGSPLQVHCKNHQVERVVPAPSSHSFSWISDRDRFSYTGLTNNRLQSPKIKIHDQWKNVSWEEAFLFIKDKIDLTKIDQRSKIAGLAGPSLTVEEYYLLQKFIRSLGSNRVDYRLKRNPNPTQPTMVEDIPWLGMRLEDMKTIKTVVLVGGFSRKQQPLISQFIKQVFQNGGKVFALDVQKNDYTYDVKSIVAPPHQWVSLLDCIQKELDTQPSNNELFSISNSFQTKTEQCVSALKAHPKQSVLLMGTDALNSQYAGKINESIKKISACLDCVHGYLPGEGGAIGAHLAGCVPFYTPDRSLEILTSTYEKPTHLLDSSIYFLVDVDPQWDTNNPAWCQMQLEKSDFVVSINAYDHPSLQSCSDVMLPCGTYFETPGSHVNTQMEWRSFDQVAQYDDTKPIWKILRSLGANLTVGEFSYSDFLSLHKDMLEKINTRSPQPTKSSVQPSSELKEQPSALPDTKTVEVWMPAKAYNTDALVRASKTLQDTQDGTLAVALVHPDTVKALNLDESLKIELVFESKHYSLSLHTSEDVASNCFVIWDRKQDTFIDGPSHAFYQIINSQTVPLKTL